MLALVNMGKEPLGSQRLVTFRPSDLTPASLFIN